MACLVGADWIVPPLQTSVSVTGMLESSIGGNVPMVQELIGEKKACLTPFLFGGGGVVGWDEARQVIGCLA
jgi:hypothetical protein